jgi:hypothetical protein
MNGEVTWDNVRVGRGRKHLAIAQTLNIKVGYLASLLERIVMAVQIVPQSFTVLNSLKNKNSIRLKPPQKKSN